MNPRTGKVERVFVNLEAVYPNPNDPNEEYSFEELRAKRRGWLDKSWSRDVIIPRGPEEQYKQDGEGFDNVPFTEGVETEENSVHALGVREQLNIAEPGTEQERTEIIANEYGGRDDRSTKPRKKRIMEVKAEAQTSKISRRTLFRLY